MVDQTVVPVRVAVRTNSQVWILSSGSRLPVKLVADMFGVDPGKVVATAIALIYDTLCVLLLRASGSLA